MFSCPQHSIDNKGDEGRWGCPLPTPLLWLVGTSCSLHHEPLVESLHISSSGWWKAGAALTQVQQNTKNLVFLLFGVYTTSLV